MRAMTILKFTNDNGEPVELEPHEAKKFKVEPLDFAQLVHAASSKNPSIPVVISNANAPCELTGLERNGPLTMSAELGDNGAVVAYGLVEGGWLPLPWAHKRVAWLDRNILISLEKLHQDHQEIYAAGDRMWLTKWIGADTDEISPILFAMEGKDQRPPTDFAMRAELGRARKIIQRVLPGATFQVISPEQRKALRRVMVEHAEYRGRATQLLLRAAPLVVNRVKPALRIELEEKVLKIADDEGVSRGSLPIIALLSCIYDSNPAISTHRAATPGRAVLKPKQNFTKEDAYNALADLFFLELLFRALAVFPGTDQVLYTQDIGIAAFWTALQPSEQVARPLGNGKSRWTITFNISLNLFPALSTEEAKALAIRVFNSGTEASSGAAIKEKSGRTTRKFIPSD